MEESIQAPTESREERYHQSGSFRVGEAVGKSFAVWARKLPTLMAIMTIIYSPLIVYNGVQVIGEPFSANVQQGAGSRLLGEFLGTMLLGFVAQAAVIYAVLQELRGESVSVGDSLRVGLVRILAVLGVTLLSAICIAAGPFLAGLAVGLGGRILLLPLAPVALAWSAYLSCALWVVVPVVVVERAGVMRALGRSSKLAYGHKWRILLILLILLVIQFGIAAVAGVVTMTSVKAGLVLELVIALLFGALSATVAAVGYHDLRRAKEGVGVDDLVKVFA